MQAPPRAVSRLQIVAEHVILSSLKTLSTKCCVICILHLYKAAGRLALNMAEGEVNERFPYRPHDQIRLIPAQDTLPFHKN